MNDVTDNHEQVLKQLLSRATVPEPPSGAQARLMQRVRASSLATRPAVAGAVNNQPKARWKGFAWVGVPLAASLALGVLFGSGSSVIDSYLPDGVVALISPASGLELDVPFGLDDSDLSDGSLA